MEIKIKNNSVRNYSNLKAISRRITNKNLFQQLKKNIFFDNNNSLNSTGYTIKNSKKNNSVDNKKVYQNGNDEKMIKEMILNLSFWNNENLGNSKFKDLKLIDFFNQEIKRQKELIKKKEEVDNLINKKLLLKENLSKMNTERKFKSKSQIFTTKDKIINYKDLIKEEYENKLLNEYQDNLDNIFKEYCKEQKNTEIKHRKELMNIYENILLNKLKKKRYESIMNDTYQILENARTEYNLCIDIIKERIKSVDKYYNAFIQNTNNNNYNSNHTNIINNFQNNNHNNININSQLNNNSTINNNIHSYNSNNNSSNNIYSSNESNITNKENNTKNDNNLKSDVNNASYLDDNISNKTQNSGESKKKMKKKTNSEIIQKNVRVYNEYISIKGDLLLELKGYDDRFSLINDQLSKIIKKAKDKIKKCEENGKYYKYLFEEFSNGQKKYYLDILKKGTDTRNEGLTWIVKRLIELKVNIDPNMFPSFLDNEQIEYIINISKLGFEKSQLKLILTALKNRNKMTKSQSVINIKNNIEKRNVGNITSSIKDKFKHNKFMEQMGKLYLKHEEYSKIIFEKQLEEKDINNSVIKNKTKLHQYAINKNIFDEKKEDNFFHIFMEHQKQKRYFDDIIQINNRIKELNIFINKLIKEQTLIFENKIKFIKLRKEESLNDFKNKVSKALFGSYIDL